MRPFAIGEIAGGHYALTPNPEQAQHLTGATAKGLTTPVRLHLHRYAPK
jgi:hypothetical protein